MQQRHLATAALLRLNRHDTKNTTTTFSNSGVTSAPTVQVSIDHSDVNIATQTALVTFTFNEPTNDFSILGSTTVNGGALSNLQTTDGGMLHSDVYAYGRYGHQQWVRRCHAGELP